MIFDIDFSTIIQTLVAHYYNNNFKKTLGEDRWNRVPKWQHAGLLAMLRAVYKPNVGHPVTTYTHFQNLIVHR